MMRNERAAGWMFDMGLKLSEKTGTEDFIDEAQQKLKTNGLAVTSTPLRSI